MVARDLLRDDGSVFVQIGDENVHLVRAILDEVFGASNFCVEITYQKTTGAGSPNEVPKMLPAVFDRILLYARDASRVKYRQIYRSKQLGGDGVSLYTNVRLSDGSTRPLTREERAGQALPDGARAYGVGDLTSSSGVDKTRYPVVMDGRTYRPDPGVWKTDEKGMFTLIAAQRIHAGTGKNLGYIRFIDDFTASPLTNLWTDTVGQNQYGGPKRYIVQTALRAVERCMLMRTDPGDLVLDPTCGSGTTAYVAEQWGRRWITCDTSRVALALARQRLMASRFPYFLLADSPEGRAKEQSLTGQPLPISDNRGDIRQGFVYERVQHITLKSIANNPDIREGMTRDEIDAAIKRHADFELLYDKPYEDNKKVRVAGPFTVESLSPHRSIAFAGQAPDPATTRSEEAGEQASAGDFEQMIVDNLRKAGIQNGRRNERLTFATIEPYPGVHVHAIGERDTDDATSPKRVGVVVGPQYGTVGSRQIMDAAKEAVKARDGQHVIDLLVVLAFAFDPQALGSGAADGTSYVSTDAGFAPHELGTVQAERSLGKLPVLLVRMNNDLVMGDDLKKTGAGNLFTVFGEPDIDIRTESVDGVDQVVVEVRGVDVYDPTTGIVRSQQTDQIALWMIDTNYNEESFFVRHCYFTGGNDPYARLKRALKSDIDEEAWASLYSTISRPFPKPDTGKIAVKVINDYGDEVLQVFEVT
jgi:adenine-specific DNA-methyltransferase